MESIVKNSKGRWSVSPERLTANIHRVKGARKKSDRSDTGSPSTHLQDTLVMTTPGQLGYILHGPCMGKSQRGNSRVWLAPLLLQLLQEGGTRMSASHQE